MLTGYQSGWVRSSVWIKSGARCCFLVLICFIPIFLIYLRNSCFPGFSGRCDSSLSLSLFDLIHVLVIVAKVDLYILC